MRRNSAPDVCSELGLRLCGHWCLCREPIWAVWATRTVRIAARERRTRTPPCAWPPAVPALALSQLAHLDYRLLYRYRPRGSRHVFLRNLLGRRTLLNGLPRRRRRHEAHLRRLGFRRTLPCVHEPSMHAECADTTELGSLKRAALTTRRICPKPNRDMAVDKEASRHFRRSPRRSPTTPTPMSSPIRPDMRRRSRGWMK